MKIKTNRDKVAELAGVSSHLDHRHFHDLHIFQGAVAGVGFGTADFPHHLHRIFGRHAESRVLTVEIRVFIQADKELRASGIRVL